MRTYTQHRRDSRSINRAHVLGIRNRPHPRIYGAGTSQPRVGEPHACMLDRALLSPRDAPSSRRNRQLEPERGLSLSPGLTPSSPPLILLTTEETNGRPGWAVSHRKRNPFSLAELLLRQDETKPQSSSVPTPTGGAGQPGINPGPRARFGRQCWLFCRTGEWIGWDRPGIRRIHGSCVAHRRSVMPAGRCSFTSAMSNTLDAIRNSSKSFPGGGGNKGRTGLDESSAVIHSRLMAVLRFGGEYCESPAGQERSPWHT